MTKTFINETKPAVFTEWNTPVLQMRVHFTSGAVKLRSLVILAVNSSPAGTWNNKVFPWKQQIHAAHEDELFSRLNVFSSFLPLLSLQHMTQISWASWLQECSLWTQGDQQNEFIEIYRSRNSLKFYFKMALLLS